MHSYHHVKSWERYVSISSPTLTPTRANGYVGENQKVVALHRVGLCFQVPKTCVIPLYHKAIRLSELYGELWLMQTHLWQSTNAQSRKSLLTTLQKYNKVFYYANFWREKFTFCHFLPKGRDMT